jgi:hypothetical protein
MVILKYNANLTAMKRDLAVSDERKRLIIHIDLSSGLPLNQRNQFK